MGRLVKNTEIDIATLNATSILANNSPVLTVANSTFDNTIYVAKNGNDLNDGRSLATPKKTIKAAMAIATAGTAVKVASGVYIEDNPVVMPAYVALLGDDLRSVFVEPANPSLDFFYMKGGTYIWGITVRNYVAPSKCFSYPPDGSAGLVVISPYIQNITSYTTTGTCVYIDGNLSDPGSTRAMILGFMTIINRNGYGLILTNQAYSQAVNIYTIACDIGIKIESGSFMTLNGSDSSIGNYGIWADGKTQLYSGNVLGTIFSGDTSANIQNLTSFPRTNNGLIFEGDPNIYFISTFSNLGGNVWNINVTSRFGNAFSNGANVTGYAVSTISASAHTMEYVGAGTEPATALPQYGGIPIPEHEVVQTNGGRVNFTSTDQKGDFRIGTGLTIVRATGTIEGDDFNRSLFAVMTPYILSIEG
jgi:hypothetical protein